MGNQVFFLVTRLKICFKSDRVSWKWHEAFFSLLFSSVLYFKFCLLFYILKFVIYLILHGHFTYYLEEFFSDETEKYSNVAFVSIKSRPAEFFCAMLKIMLEHGNLFLCYFTYSLVESFLWTHSTPNKTVILKIYLSIHRDFIILSWPLKWMSMVMGSLYCFS